MVKSIADLYLDTRKALLQSEDAQTAAFLARNVVSFATGIPQERILTGQQIYATQEQCLSAESCVVRLLQGEPLAYIVGTWDFYGMELKITRDVLIPRDDTCAVASLAIKHGLFLPSAPRILDLCTGSGCIGLAIANHIKDAKVTLADISADALAVAKKNVSGQKLNGRVSCVVCDALKAAPAFLGKFDMLVSNPPYITTEEMQQLPKSVSDYEPHLALHGGADGLDFYRAIVENYSSVLKVNGFLCFEFGMGQGDDVCRILEAHGYAVIERVKDYNERERAVIAQFIRKEEN